MPSVVKEMGDLETSSVKLSNTAMLESIFHKVEQMAETQSAIIATQRTQSSQIAQIYHDVRALKEEAKLAEIILVKEKRIEELEKEIVELGAILRHHQIVR